MILFALSIKISYDLIAVASTSSAGAAENKASGKPVVTKQKTRLRVWFFHLVNYQPAVVLRPPDEVFATIKWWMHIPSVTFQPPR